MQPLYFCIVFSNKTCSVCNPKNRVRVCRKRSGSTAKYSVPFRSIHVESPMYASKKLRGQSEVKFISVLNTHKGMLKSFHFILPRSFLVPSEPLEYQQPLAPDCYIQHTKCLCLNSSTWSLHVRLHCLN